MGIQGTTRLTRKQAEERALDRWVEAHKRSIKQSIAGMTDTELEDMLEEAFENYMIVSEENL